MNRKFLIIILILFSLLFAQVVYSATTTLAPEMGLNYSVTLGSDPATYGSWSNSIIKDGSPSCSNTTCWGTGIEDVVALTGNEFFQEYHFNASGITVGDIVSLNFCFSGCWSGGVNGCGHSDEPEFDASNGTATVQVYNVSAVAWQDIGAPINLGGWAGSNAMTYSDYCRLKNSNFSELLNNSIFKFRINVSGDYIGIGSDCEMFIDYSALQVNLPSAPGGGGGGGGSSCKPIWQCSDWGDCDLAGYKYRSCEDLNKCNVIDGVPELSMKCTAIELCNNGIWDGLEQGIDCGGVCKQCPVVEEPVVQPEAPEIQTPAPLPEYVCQPFEWYYWILYVLVLLISYTTIYRFRQIKTKLKQATLLKILIATNIVLFLLVLLDTICSFRWFMMLLLIIVFLTVVYLDKVYLEHKKKRK